MRTDRARAAAGAALAFGTACAGPGGGNDAGNGVVYDAWRAGRSNVEVTAEGSIASILGNSGGPSGTHEGFLLHLRGASGHGLTVRVEDNVDLTGQVPLSEGEDVEVRGEYVYDANGGVIHYTHRDPSGRHAAGFIRAGDTLYQ
jgi:hypothetical protein